jgi:RNA polymerase sigma-70 factor (ECF subfamily)
MMNLVPDQTFDTPPACPSQTVGEPSRPGRRKRSAPDEFDELFNSRYDALVRSLAAGFGSRARAEEAVQEAFVRAYTRWRRVRHLEDPTGWVRRVAINLLVDETRRDGREERAMNRLAELEPSVETLAPDHGERDELFSALETLPQQQRLAVTLFYLDDLSVRDVAAAMSISEGAVKYHLHEGRSRLRSRYEQRDAS